MATTANLTTLSNILKDHYQGPVQRQLNDAVLLAKRLESRDADLFGNQAVIPLSTGRTGGIGARGEDVDLAAAGAQTYSRAVYDLKYLYGRVRVTGPAIAKTSNEVGAFLQALKSEIEGVRTDLARDLSRQFYGTGDSVIAACEATGSSTTVTVLQSREAIDKGFLYPGMVVDIGTKASPTLRCTGVASTGVGVIASVDASVPSITCTAAAADTATDTDFVFRQGSAAASSVSYEINGIQNIISESAGSLGGIDASSVAFWDNLRDTTGGAVALDTIQKMLNRVNIAGGKTSLMITSFGIQRQVFNLLQSQVRFMNPMKIEGGFQTLEYAGLPLTADRDAPWGNIYFLDESTLKVFSNRDWHWLDDDGNVLKWVTGRDAWEAVLARYMQFGATRRNVNAVVASLTDTNGY